MRYLQFGVTIYNQARATPGFTLIVPNFRNEAYLIGMRGEVLHQWTNLPLRPGTYAYLLKNGNLLWAGRTAEGCPLQAGKGGLLREYDWHGNVLWEYRDDNQHHDFRRCETGNTLYLGWRRCVRRPPRACRAGSRHRARGGDKWRLRARGRCSRHNSLGVACTGRPGHRALSPEPFGPPR